LKGERVMRKIAIIGGTGVGKLNGSENFKSQVVDTPFGQALLSVGEMAGNQVIFVTRHGPGHKVAPHKVNYRANIWALKSLGTEEIFATTATGSCNPEMKAGHFVVCDQLLDFTRGRVNTFYDNPVWGVAHADFTNPYCETQRRRLIKLLSATNIPYHKRGTYVCTEGPRFETAAEVKLFARLGGDVIGMTGAQEAVLAREAEMHYTTVSIVTNMGAGISHVPLSHAEVVEAMDKSKANMQLLIKAFIEDKSAEPEVCICAHCMKEFGGFKLHPEYKL